MDAIEAMNDTDLEQMFLDMVLRHYIKDDPRYKSLEAFFPSMEKSLKIRGNTKESQWRLYIAHNGSAGQIDQHPPVLAYHFIGFEITNIVCDGVPGVGWTKTGRPFLINRKTL